MRPYISMLQEYATLYLLAPEIKLIQENHNISTAHKNMWPNISWTQRYIQGVHFLQIKLMYKITIVSTSPWHLENHILSTAHKNMRPYISMLQEYATLYLLAPAIYLHSSQEYATLYLLAPAIYLHSSQEYATLYLLAPEIKQYISWPQRLCDQYISTAHKNMWTYISWPQRLSNISTAHKNMWPRVRCCQ